MSNKHFALLLVLIAAPFFGWIYYDSQASSESIRNEGVRRDLLAGSADGNAAAQVQFLFNFPAPVYSHSLSTTEIEALSPGGGEASHYHVYGLTRADYKMDALYEFNWSKSWFKEEYRMWVENLRVDFSYNTVTVYVTSNYPEGSCEYQATLDHENQHVEIHRRVYSQYQKVLQETLAQVKSIPVQAHPVVVASKEEGKAQIAKMVSGAIDPIFDQFRDELTAEQGKIDTPESYSGLRQQCQHW